VQRFRQVIGGTTDRELNAVNRQPVTRYGPDRARLSQRGNCRLLIPLSNGRRVEADAAVSAVLECFAPRSNYWRKKRGQEKQS
jgi:hypothetical protein